MKFKWKLFDLADLLLGCLEQPRRGHRGVEAGRLGFDVADSAGDLLLQLGQVKGTVFKVTVHVALAALQL